MPNEPHTTSIPSKLWRLVALARRRALFLDYDGTLAPLREERALATPDPRVQNYLERLVAGGHTRVAIVSGRPVTELQRFLPDPGIALVGEHGWEARMPDGNIRRHPFDGGSSEWMRTVAFSSRLAPWHSRIELKRTAVALHLRGLSPAAKHAACEAARGAWDPRDPTAFALRGTDGGLELRAIGHDKGSAVRELLSDMPEETLAVFVGDDETDEDAFEVVSERGFGVRVSREDRETRAAAQLSDVEAVANFLAEWDRLGRGRT